MHITVLKMTRMSILSATHLLDINSSNAVHKWLTTQQNVSRADGKILYKIINRDDEIYMYIQSKDVFNTLNIENYGFVFVKSIEITSLQNREYVFDIQAFPCVTNNNKKLFIKDINDRRTWLENQFKKHGIDLINCLEYKKSDIIMDKDKIKRISTVCYKGKMYINDTDLAFEFILNGIGRFKNYGCGLLLIK